MSAAEKLDLAGKDWLTVEEAARYCCVSLRQFKEHAASYGLQAKNFMGRKVYAKADLYRAILGAEAWQPSTGAVVAPISNGAPAANRSVDRSGRLTAPRLRKFVARKKPNSNTA